MTQEAVNETEGRSPGRKRRILRKVFHVVLVLLLMAIAAAWLGRKDIAYSVIEDAFRDNNVRATYRIDSIAPDRQVLSNIVIGDPARPDLTIERLVLHVSPRFGTPDITELHLVRPRLYGTYREGELSFGDLDRLVFDEETDEPIEFPALELFIEDGRGLLLTDFGRVGLKVEGGGHLRGGFSAELAAISDELAFGSCAVTRPTLWGEVTIDAERPGFAGPLRFAELACEESGLQIADAAIEFDVMADRNLTDLEGDYALSLGRTDFATARTTGVAGEGQVTWRDGNLNALFDLAADDVETAAFDAGLLALEGRLRAAEQFERVEVEGDIAGEELRMGADLDGAIATAAEGTRGTLLEPLLNRLGLNLARALRGSTLEASFDARRLGERTSVTIPEARLRSGAGATIASLSRGLLTMGSDGLPRFAGNITTGGEGLPQITGRMEQAGSGALEMRLAMREYASGNARLAIPRMVILQGRDGAMRLDGNVRASGPLPGGFAQGLVLPVDGTIAPDGSIALWRGCRQVGFDRLVFSNLALTRQSLTLCPSRGAPILAYGPNGLRVAAGAPSLQLAGQLAETPIRIRSGPVGIAFPGALSARDLDIVLGPADGAQRFRITDLRADLSSDQLGGDFAGADVFLDAVPLDVLGASGNWRYIDDRLTLDGASFTLEDREARDRFEPLTARDATLTLFDNLIEADAVLRHPAGGQAVSRVRIAHDFSTSAGHADLLVDGVTFGPGFQPTDLTRRALGVVANVEGTVTGTGRIEWDEAGVRSRGEFSSDDLDFAAAFGPVRGASGTVVFTDLLGLTTAPDQRIRVAAINSGIEVYDGEIGFELVNGERINVTGGTWPFMGGTLTMRPVDINIGVQESRSYIMEITGLQASQFVERMELGNLAATGTFDGVIPIVFDADGNGQLVGGYLNSRAPGGHVSYVGELTYEDMGFFANYAFRTLRDLQYDRMDIAMNGPLTGELVTQVRFEGIRQGETAERNIVSRIIDDIPLELRVNIRAPFYKLISSIRALYDPASLRDPRSLGLIGSEGQRLRETVDQETVDRLDEEAARRAECELLGGEDCEQIEPDIQPQESEEMP